MKGYIHYLVIYVNTWTLKSTQMSNLPYSQTLSFLFASFMRNINKTGRTVENKFLGVTDDELLLLFIFQPTLYMHHRVKSGSFDIAIKKRSPFRLFSTLDLSVTQQQWTFPSATLMKTLKPDEVFSHFYVLLTCCLSLRTLCNEMMDLMGKKNS